MISSPTGWIVVLDNQRAEAVISWDPAGYPVYVDHRLGRAISVAEVTGKYHLEQVEHPIVAVLPAAGWRAQFPDDAAGAIPPEPLIGRAVTSGGNALPILRVDGDHGEPFIADDYSMELLPPGEAPQGGAAGFASPFNLVAPDGLVLHGAEFPSGRAVLDHPGGSTCEGSMAAVLQAHADSEVRRP